MGPFFEASLNAAWTQLWQVTLLVLAVWLTVRYTAQNRPHLASVLWLVVLIKSVTPPIWSSPSSFFSWLQASSTASEVLHTATSPGHQTSTNQHSVQVADFAEYIPDLRDPIVSAATFDTRDTSELPIRGSASNIKSLGGVVLVLWMLGCLGFLSIACMRGILCWSRLRRAGTVEAPEVVQLAANLSLRLGLKWPVKVIVTCSPVGPAVIGLVRPTVILPSLIVESKTLGELELLLAHEIIHIRRGDLWIGLWQVVSQAVWWFHPLVWMANRQLTREAERCCDEEVIACLGCEPGRYARSLVDVLALKLRLRTIPVFPGVRPVDVTSQRLERIMSLRQGCLKRTPYWCWLILLLAVSATLPGAALVADTGDEAVAEIQQEPLYSDSTLTVAVPGIPQIRRPRTPTDPVPTLKYDTIVATVNGQPIFAGKVLAPGAAAFAAKDAELRRALGKEYKPEVLDRHRLIFIEQSLPRMIERKMLVQAAKLGLKQSQADELKKAIADQWNEELEELMKQNDVGNVDELTQVFKKNQFNLDDHKAAFEDQKTAQMYVSSKVHAKYQPSRLEMIAYYKEYKEEFKSVGKVRWDQLVVSHQEHGGKEAAKKQIDKAVNELLAGADFRATVKKYGGGPRAVEGGVREWTERGFLQSQEVEDQLISLPVGDVSGVIETKDNFQIVHVLERTEGKYPPFEELQEKIKEQIIAKVYSDRAKELLKTVRESAIIVTCFDEDLAARKKDASIEE